MKKLILLTTILVAALVISCQTTTANLSGIADAVGKEWKLVEVHIKNQNTGFDRRTLVKDGFDNFFTLKLDADNISGVGAPNRYSAPYTASEENPLSVEIAVVRSTLMASIYQHEKLKEHEYFIYIQNTYRWGLSDGKLVLYSKTNDGTAVFMIFSL